MMRRIAAARPACAVTRLVCTASLAGEARRTAGLACAARHTARLKLLLGSLTQLDSPLGASLQLGPLGQVHSSSAQLDSLENLDEQLDPLIQPGSLGSLALLDSTALGSTTQLGSLGSLALLGLTALEVLTQLCSIQGATSLPDLVTQHASLMQLDMPPLANAPLTSY